MLHVDTFREFPHVTRCEPINNIKFLYIIKGWRKVGLLLFCEAIMLKLPCIHVDKNINFIFNGFKRCTRITNITHGSVIFSSRNRFLNVCFSQVSHLFSSKLQFFQPQIFELSIGNCLESQKLPKTTFSSILLSQASFHVCFTADIVNNQIFQFPLFQPSSF